MYSLLSGEKTTWVFRRTKAKAIFSKSIKESKMVHYYILCFFNDLLLILCRVIEIFDGKLEL